MNIIYKIKMRKLTKVLQIPRSSSNWPLLSYFSLSPNLFVISFSFSIGLFPDTSLEKPQFHMSLCFSYALETSLYWKCTKYTQVVCTLTCTKENPQLASTWPQVHDLYQGKPSTAHVNPFSFPDLSPIHLFPIGEYLD